MTKDEKVAVDVERCLDLAESGQVMFHSDVITLVEEIQRLRMRVAQLSVGSAHGGGAHA